VSALSFVAPLADIEIGQHVVRKIGGISFNLDTIWTTAIAGLIVIGLGLLARRALTKETADQVPTKLQLLWETVVDQVNSQVEETLGTVQPYVTPLAICLFFFILTANWLELIPSEPGSVHLLPAPTSDTNLTYAMALLVIVSTWVYGIRQRGAGPYFKGYISESIAKNPLIDVPARFFFTVLNIIEDLLKPVTLALRLFGNIFAGGIMISLLAAWMSWAPSHLPVGGLLGVVCTIIWKLFDMFIGLIQAFIFALLTVLYFGMAAAGHGGAEHEDSEADHGATAPRPSNQPAQDLAA
jgi:F-type H+-transporting ATPase subunit a